MHQITASVLGSVGLTLLYFYTINIPALFTKFTKRKLVKPFSCSFCISFWISLFYLVLKTDLISAIFISSAVPFIYLWIEQYITNKFQL